MLSAPPARVIRFVYEGAGSAAVTAAGEVRHYAKARLWVLDDTEGRKVILRVAEGPYGTVGSIDFGEASRLRVRGKNATVTMASGGSVAMVTNGCGCGMGAVAHAGPVDDNHKLVRVAPSDGWTEW